MTWLAPGALVLGAAALALLGALHLLARRRPRPTVLPTARFVPERPTRLLSRAVALTDPWLLALRALAVAAIALAAAQPVWARRHPATAQVVLVDRSRAVADDRELRDSVRALGGSPAVIAFDSAATPLRRHPALDSLRHGGAPGSLSAGLAAAFRAGAAAARGGDSVAIAVVSPLAPEELDAATAAIRAAWPGRLRVVRLSATPTAPPQRVEVRAPAGDPVAAAVALSAPRPRAAVRLLRGGATAADSAWAADSGGRVLVVWPVAARGAARDTVGAVVAGRAVVVAPFARGRAPATGDAVARWSDGAPAATERALGRGCVRDVAVPVDARSDLALRPSFGALVAALTAPCLTTDVGVDRAQGADAAAMLAGAGALATAATLGVAPGGPSSLAAALLALALALLAIEWLVRRRGAGEGR